MSTVPPGPPALPLLGAGEMARRIAEFDWTTTSLGPVARWPASLRTAVDACLGSRLPTAVLWGPELVMIYNDALIPLMGAKHPATGRPVAQVCAEAWHLMGEQIRAALATGVAILSEDSLVPLDRSGHLEEAYFTYSHSAIRDADGRHGGVLSTGIETTGHVLAQRRLATLQQLGEVSAVGARSPADACAAALEVLSRNRADVPFAMVHLLDDDGTRARLVAAFGLNTGSFDWSVLPHPEGGDTRWRVATTGVPGLATGLIRRYPGGTLPGAGPVGDVRSDTAVVLPLTVAGQDQPVGVISLAVSPYRALDDPYRGFLGLVARQVGGAVGDARVYAAQRDRADAARADRDAAQAVTAQLRSLVDGLAAVVWDVDVETWEVRFVSERVEEVLGYPVQRWLGPVAFWRSVLHPDDRGRVVGCTEEAVAAATDYEVTYRARAADGATVWLQDLVHVVTGADGAVLRLQGVMLDVTEQERSRRTAAVLAKVGQQQAETGPLDRRLTASLELTVPALADLGVVSILGPDGMLTPVAAARPGRGSVADAVIAAGRHPLPPGLGLACPTEQPFVVRSPVEYPLPGLGVRTALVVPLVVGGRLLGTLAMCSTEHAREHDETDLALAGELGRRVAVMIEGERLATREHQLVEITTALSAAGTVAEAATVLVAGVRASFDATAVGAYLAEPGPELRVVHSVGIPPIILRNYGIARPGDAQPIGVCAQTREPVWLRTDQEWRDHFPHLMEHHAVGGYVALMALPMLVGDRVVGALVASFGTRRTFDAGEQQFARTVTAHAAQAFERAALADTRREIAETLQRSLMPAELPTVDGLALAARYEAGAYGSQAGGDWYEVLPLAEHRVAIVVGDVVGQGATAAAVMGQLRSAVAAALLDGCGPAAALHRLDRFARRVAGALASTVACIVLDVDTGRLRWARAGHPPPLLLDPDGTPRYLDAASGAVLGASSTPCFVEHEATLPPGGVLMLYTDGLVERRGEVVDDGLARLRDLASGAVAAGRGGPAGLIDEVLARTLHPCGPPDDVALIAVRREPAPLRLQLPARPAQLRTIRRATARWATAVGLPEQTFDDLQLALGEATANSVEHAYPPGAPGEVGVELLVAADGAVTAAVRDTGVWRPEPADKGFRGRGLDLIRRLGTDTVIAAGPDGTTVTFRLAPRPGPAPRPAPWAVPSDAEPIVASLQVRPDGVGRRVELTGDLDLAGVDAVGDALRAELADTRGRVVIDVTGLTYLASAGVGLLAEALDRTAPQVTLRGPDRGPVRAVLDLVVLAPGG